MNGWMEGWIYVLLAQSTTLYVYEHAESRPAWSDINTMRCELDMIWTSFCRYSLGFLCCFTKQRGSMPGPAGRHLDHRSELSVQGKQAARSMSWCSLCWDKYTNSTISWSVRRYFEWITWFSHSLLSNYTRCFKALRLRCGQICIHNEKQSIMGVREYLQIHGIYNIQTFYWSHSILWCYECTGHASLRVCIECCRTIAQSFWKANNTVALISVKSVI